jgi:hypothetical protein
MRVVKQTATQLVLADSEFVYQMLFLGATSVVLFGLVGAVGAVGFRFSDVYPRPPWSTVVGSVLMCLLIAAAGVCGILFLSRRWCVFDRDKGTVTVELRRFAGTRVLRAIELYTVAGVRLVPQESGDESWQDITLVFKDGSTKVVGKCEDMMWDGPGAEKELRQAIQSFGLEESVEPEDGPGSVKALRQVIESFGLEGPGEPPAGTTP